MNSILSIFGGATINVLYIRDTIEAIQKELGSEILPNKNLPLLNQSSSELTSVTEKTEKASDNSNSNKNSDSTTLAITDITIANNDNTSNIITIDNTNNNTLELNTTVLSGECLEQDNYHNHKKHWHHKFYCELI